MFVAPVTEDQKTINDFYSEILITLSVLIKNKVKQDIQDFKNVGRHIQPNEEPMPPMPPVAPVAPSAVAIPRAPVPPMPRKLTAREAYDKNLAILNNQSLHSLTKAFNSMMDNQYDLTSSSFRCFLKEDVIIQLIIKTKTYEGNVFFSSLNYLL